MKSQACARCGEKSPIRTDAEMRREGWRLLDTATHNALAGGYTLLAWFCGGCVAVIEKRSQRAS